MIKFIKELFGIYDKPTTSAKGGSGTVVVNASAKAPKAKAPKTTKAATKPATKPKATKGKTGGSRTK